ncbi:TPA: hypothetical protein ACH3X1_005098 [Trebouxia sp. C0004]
MTATATASVMQCLSASLLVFWHHWQVAEGILFPIGPLSCLDPTRQQSSFCWDLQLVVQHLTATDYIALQLLLMVLIDSCTVSLAAQHHSMQVLLYTVLHVSNFSGELQVVVCV